jgi:hypothetical protein
MEPLDSLPRPSPASRTDPWAVDWARPGTNRLSQTHEGEDWNEFRSRIANAVDIPPPEG